MVGNAIEELGKLANAWNVPTSLAAPPRLNPITNLLCQDLRGEAKVLVQRLLWCRVTKGVHVATGVGVPGPAESTPCLDGDDQRLAGWDDLSPVLGRLGVKVLERGHRDDSDLNVVGLFDQLGGFGGWKDLGTGGENGDVWRGVVTDDDVGTLGNTVSVGAAQVGNGVSAESEDRWVVGFALSESELVSANDLFHIGRSDQVDLGETSVERRKGDRLVGRSVFTEGDRVVGGDTDEPQLLQSGHSGGGSGIQPEHEEGGHDTSGQLVYA